MAKKNLKNLIAAINQNVRTADTEEGTPTPKPAPTAREVKRSAATPVAETPPTPVTAPPTVHSPTISAPSPAGNAPGRKGTATSFWLLESDQSQLNELGMLLYSQGVRPSHTMILRAALRLAPRDFRLVEAVRELATQDGRKRASEKSTEE